MDLGALLDNSSWYDKCHFSYNCVKNRKIALPKTKTIEIIFGLTIQYLTMHVSILDHFNNLTFHC